MPTKKTINVTAKISGVSTKRGQAITQRQGICTSPAWGNSLTITTLQHQKWKRTKIFSFAYSEGLQSRGTQWSDLLRMVVVLFSEAKKNLMCISEDRTCTTLMTDLAEFWSRSLEVRHGRWWNFQKVACLPGTMSTESSSAEGDPFPSHFGSCPETVPSIPCCFQQQNNFCRLHIADCLTDGHNQAPPQHLQIWIHKA